VRSRREVVGTANGNGMNATWTYQFQNVPYRGPFDYVQYNWELLTDEKVGATSLQSQNPLVLVPGISLPPLGVDRPTKADYLAFNGSDPQSHATRGIELEVLDDTAPVPGYVDGNTLAETTFRDPDALNSFRHPTDTAQVRRVRVDRLRYRVRFRYPVDSIVGSIYREASTVVDPGRHYLIDTPVFDDVNVTYLGRLQIMDYRQVNE